MKFTTSRYLTILILLAALIGTTGCSNLLSDPVCHPHIKTSRFESEIAWYQNILSDKLSTRDDKANAHLRLAGLYLHYRNPKQDYDKATYHLEQYLVIIDAANANESALNLLALLQNQNFGSKSDTVKKLTKMNRELTQSNQVLQEQNMQLKATIEELNKMDMELEKRRKLMR